MASPNSPSNDAIARGRWKSSQRRPLNGNWEPGFKEMRIDSFGRNEYALTALPLSQFVRNCRDRNYYAFQPLAGMIAGTDLPD